jgi:hypothetical protein
VNEAASALAVPSDVNKALRRGHGKSFEFSVTVAFEKLNILTIRLLYHDDLLGESLDLVARVVVEVRHNHLIAIFVNIGQIEVRAHVELLLQFVGQRSNRLRTESE